MRKSEYGEEFWADFHRVLSSYAAPEEVCDIIPGSRTVVYGHPTPPFDAHGTAFTREETEWHKGFIKLQKYYDRFGQLPTEDLSLDFFQDALIDISTYKKGS